MRILVITPLYPPLHAGTFDFRVQALVEALTARTHQVRVLTSTHGLQSEQVNDDVERRLILAGDYGHERIQGLRALEVRERQNHLALREALESFLPEGILVWSLAGLSKGLIFALYRSGVPTVFGVSDQWLVQGIPEDDWLRWWNAPGFNLARFALEWTGKRHRLDSVAPTRLTRGYDRMPEIYGEREPVVNGRGRAVAGFRFDRVFFASRYLRNLALEAGYPAGDSAVVPCLVSTQTYQGAVRSAQSPLRKVLVVGPFSEASGLDTTLSALRHLYANGMQLQLTAYGRSDSRFLAPLKSFVVQHQLAVNFVTPADQARELGAVFRQHDLLVYPNEVGEGTGSIPMQAMACGLPVVGTDLGAAGEWILPEETGLCFRVSDYVQLAQQIARLVQEPTLRDRLATTAQARVVTEASEIAVLDRLETLFEEARQLRSIQ